MLGADPPNVAGASETARRTIRDANRAAEVIKRLRALFANKAPTMERIDLNETARELIALTSSELQRGRVLLQTEFAGNLPIVEGDRIQLQQVMLNLLLNAADAMADVEDRPRNLTVRTAIDREGNVELLVRDSGTGLDPQVIQRLFDPFYTTKSKGMGVGLSISRTIIENHGGRIWAVPNDGPGATFAFSLPGTAEGTAEAVS
jgi:signal transduction histidine kinase